VNTPAELRAHADVTELAEIEFLDRHGRIAGCKRKYRTVRLKFIDGRQFLLSRRDMEREFRDYAFKLRPSRNHG
jgi:hypothetical protein